MTAGALVVLVLCAGERLVQNEVEAGVGLEGASYLAGSTRMGDAVFTPFAAARGHLGPVAGELTVLGATSLSGNASASFTLAPRIGFTGPSWSLLVGVVLQDAPATPAPLQLLPSLRLAKRFDELGVSLGVFDFGGLLPAHLSFDTEHFSLGYVAPLGVRASLRFPLNWCGWELELHGFGYRLLQAEVAMVALSVRFGGAL